MDHTEESLGMWFGQRAETYDNIMRNMDEARWDFERSMSDINNENGEVLEGAAHGLMNFGAGLAEEVGRMGENFW